MRPWWAGVTGDSPTAKPADDGQGPVFVFCPRGPNWQWSMVQRVHRKEPVFRDVLHECDGEIRRHLGWSVDELLGRAPEAIVRSFSEEHFQPTLTAVQIAQVEVWRRRGLGTSAVAGFSGGEIAAAYAAGALSAEETLRVACASSLRLKEGGTPRGAMIAARVDSEEAARLRLATRQPVHILVESAPKSTVFGGTEEAIGELVSLLDRRGVRYQRLPTSFVFHIPLLDSGKAAFLQRLTGLTGRRPATPVYSAAAGGLLRDARFDAQHWYDVLTRPALVGDATHGLLQSGYARFLSISLAHGVMFPIRHIASTVGKEVVISSSLDCLAKNEAPFRRQDSTWTAANCSALKRRLSPARRGWSRTDASGFS